MTSPEPHFRCFRAHRGEFHPRDSKVVLTGKTRLHHPKRGKSRAPFSTPTMYEYVCSCGYKGWSNHIELARMAEK